MSRSWRTVDLDFTMEEGSDVKRFSRRNLGKDPEAVEALDPSKFRREMKNLFSKGGRGGQKYEEKTPEWEYFPSKLSGWLPSHTRKAHNENVFRNLNDISEENLNVKSNELRQSSTTTYQMVNLQHLQDTINEACASKATLDSDINDFITFIVRRDNQMNVSKLKKLKAEWKAKRKKKKQIKIECENIGLHPCITLQCPKTNKRFQVKSNVTKYNQTSYKGAKCANENCSWYDVNLRLVLATLASGLGPSDITTFLSFLGLPNLTSFSRKQFHRIEMLIGQDLRFVGNASMKDALDEEIRMTQEYKNQPKFNWRLHRINIGLTVAYDMGWTKRSSGNRYDSLSGHAFLVGCHSRKIIAAQITSKQCSLCSSAATKEEKPPEHECPKNYIGSSKAMEADGALSLVKNLDKETNSKVYVESFVADDDSSIRAILRHPSKRGRGRLPKHIREPKWLADPSHRTKVVANAIFALVKKTGSICTNADALRVKKYFGYMLKQARFGTIQEIIEKCKCVIEHLFNNHQFCDERWCVPSQIAKQTKREHLPKDTRARSSSSPVETARSEDLPPSPISLDPADNRQEHKRTPNSFYRFKETDNELYHQMMNAYSKYTTPERLVKSLHPFHTQLNESLNKVVSNYCPKDRTYATTMSFHNRISIVIGCHNLGHSHFWKQVFNRLELSMTSDLLDNLSQRDQSKDRKRKYNAKREVKLKRIKVQNEKMQEMMKKQKLDEIRGATYKSGVALLDLVPSAVSKLEEEKKDKENINCKLLGCNEEKKHKSNRSKNCRYHTCSSAGELRAAVDKTMRQMYPQHYGEFISDGFCLDGVFTFRFGSAS